MSVRYNCLNPKGATVFRSDDWLKATYDTIMNNTTFTTYGTVHENVKGFFLSIR